MKMKRKDTQKKETKPLEEKKRKKKIRNERSIYFYEL